MNEIYAKALAGTLASSPNTSTQQVLLNNQLGMSLMLFWVTPGGLHAGYDADQRRFVEGEPGLAIPAGHPVQVTMGDGDYFLVTTAYSGAFVAAVNIEDNPPVNGTMYLDSALLLEPGVVGPVPKPTDDRPIPLDSPRVLVGVGALSNGSLGREQYWRLSPDSYSLAPGETVSVGMTQTSGMDNTSSDQEVVADQFGVSAGAGWGTLSASMSASLSRTSTTFQQVTLETQTTMFRSVERTNDGTEPVTYFVWQLTEVVTAYDSLGLPQASVVSTIAPPLVSAGSTPSTLAPHPARHRMPPGAPGNRAEVVEPPGG